MLSGFEAARPDLKQPRAAIIREPPAFRHERHSDITPDSPLCRKLAAFVALSPSERDRLAGLHRRLGVLAAGRDLVHQGQMRHAAYIVISGWVCVYKVSRSVAPDRRFPDRGRFPGTSQLGARISDHSLEPLTDIRVAEVVTLDLIDAFSRAPRLAATILWAA